MIKCPNCNMAVSEFATTCPHCGKTIDKESVTKAVETRNKQETPIKRTWKRKISTIDFNNSMHNC